MMQRVLYIDDSSNAGASRFHGLERSLGREVVLQFIGVPVVSPPLTIPKRWDVLVADVRGLAETHRDFVAQVVEASPDAVLILVAETLDPSAADAVLNHGAIDCVSSQDGYDVVAETVRRTLSRLTLARGAITSMNSRIDEFDMTLAIGLAPNVANSLAKYTLRHLAQMDVCGLREQFRAIRAFEESLEKLLRHESSRLAESAVAPASVGTSRLVGNPARNQVTLPRSVSDPAARVRIHLSADGLRFTLRCSDVVTEKVPDRKPAMRDGFADADGLWFASLFMDEIAFDESGHEMTMLKLPDDVCRVVSQAIARQRCAQDRKQDLLSDVLKVFDGQGG